MVISEMVKVGKRGVVIIPARLRERYGMREGTCVVVEEREDGFLLRPAGAMPHERYTPDRRAEFILSNAVDAEDYARAVEEVRRMGLDPEKIDHLKPPKS